MLMKLNKQINLMIFFKIKLPEIDVDALIMERILNLSTHYTKQLVYRNINKNLYIKQESMFYFFY